jgi:hypothetical protein
MSASTTLQWQADLLDAQLRATVRRRTAASSGRLVPAIAAGVILTVALGVGQTLRSQLQDLRHRAAVAKERVQKLSQQAGAGDAQARARNAEALEAEVNRRRSLLAALKQDDTGESVAAASVLMTLAKRHRDGLWLTRISIDQARQDLTLEGQVLDPRELAAYVAGLGQGDSAVGGLAVDVVETKGEESGGNAVQPASASAAPAGATTATAGTFVAPKSVQFRITGRHTS